LLPSSKQGMNINLLCGKNFVHPKNPSLCTWWRLTFNKKLIISKVIITCYVIIWSCTVVSTEFPMFFHSFMWWAAALISHIQPLLHRTSYKYNSYNSFAGNNIG
jgi:hypothetical protein